MLSPVRASLVLITILLALVPAVAGCGSDDTKSSDTRALVTFAKSGGIGGKAYSLVIDRGGGGTLTTYPSKTKKFNIGGDKRDKLVGLLDAIKDVGPRYDPSTPSADDFRYSITYQEKTVQASDSAKLPDSLRSLINLLNGIIGDER